MGWSAKPAEVKSDSYHRKLSRTTRYFMKSEGILTFGCFWKYFLATVSKIIEKVVAVEWFRTSNQGAILIEFAVVVPILIILLFYSNDLMKLNRMHYQIEFVAQQMANILQNISQKREEGDQKITRNDIRYAASLAYLSVFPGKTEFPTSDRTSTFGYSPLGYIHYVKGNSNSTASVVWTRRFHMADKAYEPSSVAIDQGLLNRSNVKRLIGASPSEIHPMLKIEKDEVKIIIECALHYSQSSGYGFTDGRKTSEVSPSQAFGLKLYKLSPPKTRAGSNDAVFFHHAVFFVPRPGLFDETPPK